MKNGYVHRSSFFILHYSFFIIHCLHYSPVFRDKLLFHALQLVRHTGVQAEATQFDDVSSDQAFVHLLFQDYLTVRLLGSQFLQVCHELGRTDGSGKLSDEDVLVFLIQVDVRPHHELQELFPSVFQHQAEKTRHHLAYVLSTRSLAKQLQLLASLQHRIFHGTPQAGHFGKVCCQCLHLLVHLVFQPFTLRVCQQCLRETS